jgi:predicted 2-oxoglutarate/Fe(II)-dependent dioxygenase YbiX
MGYYTVDYCDLTPYGDYHPPSLNDGMIVVECFDRPSCDRILESVKQASTGSSGVHDLSTGEKVDTYHRSSSYCNVTGPVYQEVLDRISFVVNYHCQPQIMRTLKSCEPVQFLKYDSENSGHFNRHTDDAYWSETGFQRVAPYRKFTTITYLNDDYEGGEIVLDTCKDPQGRIFCQQGGVGTTIIFPSDIRFPHEVKPVVSGVRYSIVVWFDFA